MPGPQQSGEHGEGWRQSGSTKEHLSASLCPGHVPWRDRRQGLLWGCRAKEFDSVRVQPVFHSACSVSSDVSFNLSEPQSLSFLFYEMGTIIAFLS